MFVVKVNNATLFHEDSMTLAINSALPFRVSGEVTIVVGGEVVLRLFNRRIR